MVTTVAAVYQQLILFGHACGIIGFIRTKLIISNRALIFISMIPEKRWLEWEQKVRTSDWWHWAAQMPDSHYTHQQEVRLTHHLEAVHQHVQALFERYDRPFWSQLKSLLPRLRIKPEVLKAELSLVALLHDIGKTKEDKTLVIPHPLTGKAAHMRHGVVSLMATMEILGKDLEAHPEVRQRIYRTVELHDMSYGLYRDFKRSGQKPTESKWAYIDQKVHTLSGAGLMYLLIFKLADTHGHAQLHDVSWFFETVREHYFEPKGLHLPVPTEADLDALPTAER